MATTIITITNDGNYSGKLQYVVEYSYTQDAAANTTTLTLTGYRRNLNTYAAYNTD